MYSRVSFHFGGPRFKSSPEADIDPLPVDVRFTPKSGHCLSASGCPLSAKRRHFGG
jgi:hypothetical protein